jgi:hypothetical protein
MELEIMLYKVSQTQKDKYHISLICGIYIWWGERHESRRGTIWEEERDQLEGAGKEDREGQVLGGR